MSRTFRRCIRHKNGNFYIPNFMSQYYIDDTGKLPKSTKYLHTKNWWKFLTNGLKEYNNTMRRSAERGFIHKVKTDPDMFDELPSIASRFTDYNDWW